MKHSRIKTLVTGVLAGTLGLLPVTFAAAADNTAPRSNTGAPGPAEPGINTAAGSGNPGDVSGKTTSGDIGTATDRALGAPVGDPQPATTANTGPGADSALLQRVHEANQRGIALAQLAVDRSASAKVKSYGHKLLNDQQAADKRLMTYAERKIPGSASPEGRSTDSKVASADETQSRLSALSGADFDREFANAMIEEQDRSIDLVKNARDSTTDKQLRAIYDGMLPKIEQHKRMARDLADGHVTKG